MTAASSPADATAAPRSEALDGLRGIAILLVLFVHFIGDAAAGSPVERALVKLANYGVWGVDLFFVLSGFLITGILYDAKEQPHYLRNFYVRRTLRIFPLYYGVLILLFVILPALPVAYPTGLAESARHQAWLWGYGTNFYLAGARAWALPYVSHFWSLAVEEHFYLVWPLVVLVTSRGTLLRVCVGLSVFALALRCALSFALAGDVSLVALTPGRLDALCCGAFLAIAVRAVGVVRVAKITSPLCAALPALVLVVSAWCATTGAGKDVLLPVRGTLVALSFGALLIASLVAPRDSWHGGVLRSGALRLFGKYSYGLYVFHGVIAYWLHAQRVNEALTARSCSSLVAMILVALGGAGLSLLVAIASYELFEKHFLGLKDLLAPSSRPPVANRVQVPATHV